MDGYIEKKLAALEGEMNGDWRRQERMMPNGMVVHRSVVWKEVCNGDE